VTFRMARLTCSRGRRLFSAALTLLYFWAFVALGLTHTHGVAGIAARRPAPAIAGAHSPAACIGRAASRPDDDAPCAVCAAVHAATVALAQPPVPVHTLLAAPRLAAWSSVLTPRRTPRTSRSRAPPQV
jgi:hypothetical protein